MILQLNPPSTTLAMHHNAPQNPTVERLMYLSQFKYHSQKAKQIETKHFNGEEVSSSLRADIF